MLRSLAIGFWSIGLLLALPSFADLKDKPVSVSYINLTTCYPELKNEALSHKVDLNLLKDEIDRKFVTSQSLLRYRQVLLKDGAGQQKRLKLSAKPARKKGQYNYLLSVDKLDDKKTGTAIEIPQSQRTNPKQKDLDPYFLNHEIMEDERSYFDTKLNGMELSFKRNFQNVFELELNDSKAKKRLFCEDQKETGIVCTCFRK
ncbi:hypothetical protein [Bdellovibrio sp. HCB337]|uniref:hypothetical protein n=1 Tax=Bdellovibrio sp. HCB337 TaxID=3394358 RepID=UPI0039A4F8E5